MKLIKRQCFQIFSATYFAKLYSALVSLYPNMAQVFVYLPVIVPKAKIQLNFAAEQEFKMFLFPFGS